VAGPDFLGGSILCVASDVKRGCQDYLESSEAGHFEACYRLIAGTTRVAVLHNQFSALHQPLKKKTFSAN
jgi:hypothetical protein